VKKIKEQPVEVVEDETQDPPKGYKYIVTYDPAPGVGNCIRLRKIREHEKEVK
jgi:hypothetical protein